jgi:uncharacterized OB-fold protein
MTPALPDPEITPINAPYWRALDEGRLVFQCCRGCGHRWLPPRAECPGCLGDAWDWRDASGRGRLVSWVVYRVAYHDSLRDRLPYNVAVVELDEGPRLITSIPDRPDGAGLTMDARVTLVTPPGPTGRRLAMFHLEEASGSG